MEGGLENVAESIMRKMATGCQCHNMAQNDFSLDLFSVPTFILCLISQ